ncbi:MAG: winged helix DNA-binding protein [Alphaproteobacteria bacterium]
MSEENKTPGLEILKASKAASEPIVSSDHLATEIGWPLSELEFGLIIAYNAFSRWMVRCMNAAGAPDLAALDILVLHNVNHRKREKRLGDICLMLNVEEAHTVAYALKKLTRSGFVEGKRRGKEMHYATTETGQKLCEDYRRVREQCLVNSFNLMFEPTLSDVRADATLLRTLSGLYDQAARTATSL